MSDSYSAWCEEREECYAKFEKKHEAFEKIKDTKEFKTKLKQAKSNFKRVKITLSKSCTNCRHFCDEYCDKYGNTQYICLKHCIDLHKCYDDCICDKWEAIKGDRESTKNINKYFSVDPFIVSLK